MRKTHFIRDTFSGVLIAIVSIDVDSKIPAGFEELFVPRTEKLDIYVKSDSSRRSQGIFLIKGEDVILDENSEINSLKELGLNKSGIDLIETKLRKGVRTSTKCKGFRHECKIVTEDIEFVYEAENRELIIFAAPKFMVTLVEGEESFLMPDTHRNALIVHNSLSYNGISTDNNSYQDSYSYYNEAYLSVTDNNYIQSKSVFTNSNGLRVEDISYNYISNNVKLKVGYSDSNEEWNATDRLGQYNGLSAYSLAIGSTNQLRVRDEANDERVYFSSPRAGRLEVTNSQGRVLISKNIFGGTQYFSYSELPYGTYNAFIKVYDGDNIIYNKIELIVNDRDYDTRTRKLDYKLSLGYFSTDHADKPFSQSSEYFDNYSPIYTDMRMMKKIYRNLSLGAGMLSTSQEFYGYAGFDYTISEGASLSTNLGIFNNNDSYQLFKFNWKGFNLSWSAFKKQDVNDIGGLSSILFYSNNYENSNLKYSRKIDNDNTFYLTSSYNKVGTSNNGTAYSNEFKSITLGYSRHNLPFNSNINLEVGASVDKYSSNNIDIGLTLSLPLGGSHSFSHGSYYNSSDNHDDNITNRSNINSIWLNDENKQLSTNIGFDYNKNVSTNNSLDMSTSLTTSSDELSTSSYFYVNSLGTQSGSVFLESNFIVTKDSAYITSKKAQSYFIARNDSGYKNLDDKFPLVVSEYKNNNPGRIIDIVSESNIEALDTYNQYHYATEPYSPDFFNAGERAISGTSFPGTIIQLDTELISTTSFIAAFVDENGDTVDQIECIGAGCMEYERLTEGIYHFKVKEGKPFELYSHSNKCIMPSLENSETRNIGQVLCSP